ncbi:hypothetical protein ACQKWADRAFT_315706 [Trichoderma austrokoningii]
MYLITDFIPGEPLDRKHRLDFYSQLIDILVELQRLEIPLIGSLIPSSDGSPLLGPAISMTATTLRLPSVGQAVHEAPIRSRVGLFITADRGPFVLSHLDLRSCNIIVDEHLHIQGIIDWEFTSTVPLQLFTPPSWITGHDPMETDEQMPAEFYAMLLDKSTTDDLCQRLRRKWYHKADAAADNSDKHLGGMMTDFFGKNPALASEAQYRAEQCARYTLHLKEHGLYETEEDRLLAQSTALKEKWGWP